MDAILGAIDPALLEEGVGTVTTNGATISPIAASRSRPASATRPTQTFSRADTNTWQASNYAPQRDVNETRADYEDRLTHVSRKNPLVEACTRLGIKTGRTWTLERLCAALSDHCRTFTVSSSQKYGQGGRRSSVRATDQHDVLASALAHTAQPFHFSVPNDQRTARPRWQRLMVDPHYRQKRLAAALVIGRSSRRIRSIGCRSAHILGVGRSSGASSASGVSTALGAGRASGAARGASMASGAARGTSTASGAARGASTASQLEARPRHRPARGASTASGAGRGASSTSGAGWGASTSPGAGRGAASASGAARGASTASGAGRGASTSRAQVGAHPQRRTQVGVGAHSQRRAQLRARPQRREQLEAHPPREIKGQIFLCRRTALPPLKLPAPKLIHHHLKNCPSPPNPCVSPFGIVCRSRLDSPFCGSSHAVPHHIAPPRQFRRPEEVSPLVHITAFQEGDEDEDSEAALIRRYDVEGANHTNCWGTMMRKMGTRTRTRWMRGRRGTIQVDPSQRMRGADGPDPPEKRAFPIETHVLAVKRAAGNRRAGGLKTQNAMVRAWNEFTWNAMEAREIDDPIVEEHSLLRYIKFALNVPSVPAKASISPVHSWVRTYLAQSHLKKLFFGALRIRKEQDAADPSLARDRPAVTNRMDEGCGLVPGEDAPDIRANTWLPDVTEEQLEAVGKAFLAHSHWGGKAGKRGCVVNPVYTVFIPHLWPEMCPFGAFAFYFHYLHDEKNITQSMKIDWTVNSSLRSIRVLHGQNSPITRSTNRICITCTACLQECGIPVASQGPPASPSIGIQTRGLGVDAAETSCLGWVRGETYMDTYAPSLPKKVILAAAGYRDDEPYDPIWCHVNVPEQFLKLVCPIAEEILDKVTGRANMSGTTNHWQLVVKLRPYLFQCGAAIYQKWPQSSIFRLPAFMHTDIPLRSPGCSRNPIDLERIQNTLLRVALEEMRSLLASQNVQLKKLAAAFERRTSIFSPAQGFSASNYHSRALASAPYQMEDSSVAAASSPGLNHSPPRMDLVEPPVASYYEAGGVPGIFPPLLGQKSVHWSDVFKVVKQPHLLWSAWGPHKTLEQFGSIEKLWTAFIDGAPELDASGNSTGRLNPPLKLVEQYFQASWRCPEDKKERANIAKIWQRFREIPEWIDSHSTARDVSPDMIITELQAMRVGTSVRNEPRGLNWLQNELAVLRKAAKKAQTANHSSAGNLEPSSSSTSSSTSLGAAFVLQEPSTGTRRKREAAIDARRRPKKKLKMD
ncbi:hypothetical protein B0H17DRAFT_1304922 [Mycena rosella]|uniref:Uncharacterized protein n=1 Tax=Mycena rosella TaxID=1033263 RepID=A0AAD7GF51_MYCRO|nr:hypothetical protein B0H17DRAFT_1304922 [Mycena rosella]